jgi:hypothetical protein
LRWFCLDKNTAGTKHIIFTFMKNMEVPMIRKLIVLALIAGLLAACAPTATAYPNDGYPADADSPTSSDTPVQGNDASFAPQPSDASLTRGEAFVHSTDLLTLESYPLQFTLTWKGSLPTPCAALRVDVAQPDADNKINVEVYSVSDPNKICAEMLKDFEVNVPLGSFPTGRYFLIINGKQAAEFQS